MPIIFVGLDVVICFIAGVEEKLRHDDLLC